MLSYLGFEISDNNKIYLNGKQVFTAFWQLCADQDECKRMIDLSVEEKLNQLRRVDIGRSLAVLKTDLSDEAAMLDADKWNERIELHETIKLLEP